MGKGLTKEHTVMKSLAADDHRHVNTKTRAQAFSVELKYRLPESLDNDPLSFRCSCISACRRKETLPTLIHNTLFVRLNVWPVSSKRARQAI